MNTSPEIAASRWQLRAALLAGLALLSFNLIAHCSIADDAYISFRYLDNWLDGSGLVYNPGQRVEGYTNFLWVVLLAPLRLLGAGPESAALLLSLVSLVLLLWAVFRCASRLAASSLAGWTALILAAGSVPLASWTVSGMETTCFAALLALANQQLVERERHACGSSLAFGLAVLARPSGALHAAVAFLAALPFSGAQRLEGLRRLLAPGLAFLLLPVAHLAFRLHYYGLPLPNTFYAKLVGDLPSPIPGGLAYLGSFLASGGILLVIAGLPLVRSPARRSWVVLAIAGQVAAQMIYSVGVGGDYFPFHRFLVPAIPGLAVLGGLGLSFAARRVAPTARTWLPAVAIALALLQTALATVSVERSAFRAVLQIRSEREQIADWLASRLPDGTSLAINAAGLIPYRTGFPTIDMLGLNDAHIARAQGATRGDGAALVGHSKHDGAYVCSRAPDAVITSGARLHPGRSADEAIIQAAVNTFPGDREFLRDPACRDHYRAESVELAPGRFLVLHLRLDQQPGGSRASFLPTTAEGWFRRGIALMRQARLGEAVEAFQASLDLGPDNPAATTNLGFCLADLAQHERAVGLFQAALRMAPRHYDALFGLALSQQQLGQLEKAAELWRRYLREAPESPWKETARRHLRLLSPAGE
jgi:hypothetical protein